MSLDWLELLAEEDELEITLIVVYVVVVGAVVDEAIVIEKLVVEILFNDTLPAGVEKSRG